MKGKGKSGRPTTDQGGYEEQFRVLIPHSSLPPSRLLSCSPVVDFRVLRVAD